MREKWIRKENTAKWSHSKQNITAQTSLKVLL